MKNRIKAPALLLAGSVVLSGCNLLDVDNPNSLVEESIQQEAAANGVTNGSLRLVSNAVADIWEGPAVVADELYWTGSRDAWGQLDQGHISDPLNEFTDAAFPTLGRAVWMAQNAVDILTGHVADPSDPADLESFRTDLARAQMFNGIILMVTGELQEDMTFSNKMEDGPPVGPDQMSGVLDDAISNLSAAITTFNDLGETDLELAARAIRARAHMSRTIWDELNPSAPAAGSGVNPLAYPAEALTDAAAVIAVGGDWKYNLAYSSASGQGDMLQNVNNRGENQWDPTLVENDGPGASGRTGVITLIDPYTGAPDNAVATALAQWGENQYGALTITSERLMRLIVAENDLATGGGGAGSDFETQMNALRGLDGDDFASGGAVTDLDMLAHARRVNVLHMGLRLQDMYRWGLQDPTWQGGSAAAQAPGTMLPITIIEIRANCHLNEVGCSP